MQTRRVVALLSLLFFIALGAAPAGGQQISYHRVEQDVVEARLKTAAAVNHDREKKLHQLFEEAGCKGPALVEAPAEGSPNPNVLCTLAGATNSVILVGAHFDHVEAGQGVVDNWSGAALLPTLFQSLQSEPRRHTFIFVGFTDEEKDLLGSDRFLQQMTPGERAHIRAMINLDSLGLSSTKVWLSHADPELAQSLNNVAHSMKLPLAAVNVEQVGRSDSETFAKWNIPSMTVHSVTQETFPILHSTRDTLAAIRLDDYYDTYRLLAAYLAYLDQKLPTSKPAPQQ